MRKWLIRLLTLTLALLFLSGTVAQATGAEDIGGRGTINDGVLLDATPNRSPICGMVSVGDGFVAWRENGSVYTEGLYDSYEYTELAETVEGWSDITAISHTWIATMGLRQDGSVLLAGASTEAEAAVSTWNNVVDIKATYGPYQYALTAEGRILSTDSGGNSDPLTDQWKNITEIYVGLCSEGSCFFGIDENRSVLWRIENQENWDAEWAEVHEEQYGWSKPLQKVRAFSSSGWSHLALLDDGTVACAGTDRSFLQTEIAAWSGIRRVYAGDTLAIALTEAGNVRIAGGREEVRSILSKWSDLAWLYVHPSNCCVVGGRADGEVFALFNIMGNYFPCSKRFDCTVSDLICYYGSRNQPKLLLLTEDGETVLWEVEIEVPQ